MSNTFWQKHAQFIENYYWLVLLLFTVLTLGSLHYAYNHLGVNSDTSEMFDESLPFRKEKNRYNELFPLNRANITIVLESSNPDKLDGLSKAFADSLKAYEQLFTDIYIPGSGPYFKRNQLLFVPEKQLDSLSVQLRQAAQFFSVLSQDYSLEGLFTTLNNALTYADEAQIRQLNPIFAEMDSVVANQLEGETYSMSWQRIMQPDTEGSNRNRRFIQVKPQRHFDAVLPAKPAILKTRELAHFFETHHDAKVSLTGRVVMSYEEMQAVIDGTLIAGILALIMVSITLWIGLRSFRLIVSSLIALVMGLSITVGFSAVAVGQLNMISVAFAVLYIGLGIDYAIHFTLKFKELRYHEHPFRKSLKETASKLSTALVLSTFSTSCAFFAFIPTSFDGVSELGIIAGAGMFISLIITFTLLPALLKVFRSDTMRASEVTLSAPYSSFVAPFLNTYSTPIKIVGGLAALASFFILPAVTFDYNPINLRNDKSESVETMKRLMDSEGYSAWSIELIAENREEVEQIKSRLDTLDVVRNTRSLDSFVPKNQAPKLKILNQLQPDYAQIGELTLDTARLRTGPLQSEIEFFIKQVDFFENSSPQLNHLQGTLTKLIDRLESLSLEQKRSLLQHIEFNTLETLPGLLENLKLALRANKVTRDDLPSGIRDRWATANQQLRVQINPADFMDDNNEELRYFASQVRPHINQPTGNLITAIESGDAVVAAFRQALIYAFIVISIIIFLFLRSLKETFYILLPLILTGILTGAAMVPLGLSFNFANIIALPMILGLGVDNGIHIVHRSLAHHDNQINILKTSTARAIFFSSLTTLFSFGNLAFSPHNGTSSLGILLTLGLLFMMFATLVVLPAFLIDQE